MKASTKYHYSRAGSALLIILAFILLLSIIATAFLSKAMLEKNVSNASSDQTRTDVFAAGAVDAILSDCQQEIGAGSKTATTTPAIYLPNSALTIVPSRMGSGSSNTTVALNFSATPNLVKCSAGGVKFYPTGDSTDFPNAGVFPPSEKTFATVDPNNSTSVASLNGRSYPAVRWNQALLLPKKTPTSNTDFTPVTGFTVPDWILVQRDGTNPTAWSTSLCIASPNDVTTTNKNPVVGRYAYTIYDEGGLLDMNVTGYPSVAGPASSTPHFYRSSLASVDLMQLMPTAGGTPYFPSTGNAANPGNPIIDSIVGWRNGATLQAAGAIGAYTFSSSPAGYFTTIQPPGTAFLHATIPSSVTSLTGGASNGQSDRKFSSRQQLIDLILNGIVPNLSSYPQTTAVAQANMQNALQYMGTFSRDLSQPSYIPDSARPRMKANTTLNGTDGVLDLALYGANASASDDSNNYINVPFPTTQVQTAFTRNDGSPANVGDPLVKRRFALNRLAWLTYAGPIATDAGAYTNATTTAIATNLKNTYGYTDAFLQQGGPTNIKNYFGLQWQQDPNDDNATKRSKWFYNVHNNSVSAGVGIIRELGGTGGLAADTSPRDPDFFELLKAAIVTGSKGKTLTYLSATKNPTDPLHPLNVQNGIDVSLDYQILQIGANIIDQSRTDAYTTEIVFDNGTGPFEVRGIENYPYLYRIRSGSMALRNITPATGVVLDTSSKAGLSMAAYPNFKDTGIAAFMEIPEIWNPHDVNAPMGSPYPTSFRIVLDSTNPANLVTAAGSTTGYETISALGTDTAANTNDAYTSPKASSNTATSLSPAVTYGPGGTGGTITGGYSGENQIFSAATDALTFTVPAAYPGMFREPTMLARPNVPSGSNLALGWTPSATSDLGQVKNSAGTLCYNGTGFLSDVPNPLSLTTAPATSQAYIGFVLGIYPIQFACSKSPAGSQTTANTYIYVSGLGFPPGSPNSYLTYRMQYQDPVQGGWVTYDEKYMLSSTAWVATPTGGAAGSGNLIQPTLANFFQSSAWQSWADPRTSRFGAPGGDNNAVAYFGAPGTKAAEWLGTTQSVLFSDRPDYNQGFLTESYRTANGATQYFNTTFAPGWSAGFTSTTTGSFSVDGLLRWGPLSQNTASATAQAVLRYAGDAGGTPSTPALTYNYADADGVVRRAMGGLVPNSSSAPSNLIGYPMATATYSTTATANGATGYTGVIQQQSSSRPYLLKRPFTSVGELGYVFSGTPWRNLDFSNPESGDSPLLDIFCISDTDDPNALVAGKVNLNTQQTPVLAAILAEAYYNDQTVGGVTYANNKANAGYINASADSLLTSGSAYTTASFSLATYLTARTATAPLSSLRDLVGKWVNGTTPTAGTMGTDGTSTANYAGYSSDISAFYAPSGGAGASYLNAYNTRFREASVRALSAVGQTRVWNLMIDVVAQTGRYPATATDASKFLVEGERRYWVHVAIDRYTGNILDRQIEEVRQ